MNRIYYALGEIVESISNVPQSQDEEWRQKDYIIGEMDSIRTRVGYLTSQLRKRQ